jgi:hypothetical protein
MKLIKKGRAQNGWAQEILCTGNGNGGGGCSATLLVEIGDLFLTFKYDYGGGQDQFVTFQCPECGVKTDVKDSLTPINTNTLPTETEWEAEKLRIERENY